MDERDFSGRRTPEQSVLEAAAGGTLSHAYIVAGQDASEGRRLAGILAAALMCDGGAAPCGTCRQCKKLERGSHPDLVGLDREGGEIKASDVRALGDICALVPNEASRRVVSVYDAQNMNTFAQNALLSLLEEAPLSNAFVLVCDRADALLQTVRSRCVTLRLQDVRGGEEGAPDENADRLFEAVSSGDELRILEACIPLEGLGRDGISLTLGRLQERFFAELSGGVREGTGPYRGAGKTAALIGCIEKIRGYCEFNAGAAQLSGLLAVYFWEAVND